MRHLLANAFLSGTTLLLLGACSADSADTPSDASDAFSLEINVTTDASSGDVGTDTGTDTSTGPVVSLAAALDQLNARRDALGMPAVILSPNLTAGCLAHIDYMRGEGAVVHDQDPGSPFYTTAGATAGPNALVAGGVRDMGHALSIWLGELYHRIGLLDPGVSSVGAAFEDGYACLDIYSGYEEVDPFTAFGYPTSGETGVPTTYENVAGVTPVPANIPGPVGTIISLTFAPSITVGAGFKATLINTSSGALVDSFVRLPAEESDPYATLHRNTVALIPLAPLAPGTTYTVTMSGDIDESYIERTWSFGTATP